MMKTGSNKREKNNLQHNPKLRVRKRSFYVNASGEYEEFHIPCFQEFDYLFPQPQYTEDELGYLIQA